MFFKDVFGMVVLGVGGIVYICLFEFDNIEWLEFGVLLNFCFENLDEMWLVLFEWGVKCFDI